MPTISKPKKKTQQNSIVRQERIKVYNSVRWRRIRDIKLATDPLCEKCASVGITRAAEDTSHSIIYEHDEPREA